jgi:membrane associated rhomboid family serine protease
MSRSDEIIRATPPITVAMIAVCVVLYVVQVLLGHPSNLASVTLCPQLVIYGSDYYRIMTSALYHANLMHIGMNMMSTAAVSSMLEKHMGSIPLLFTLLWSILLTSTVYVVIALMLSMLFSMDDLMSQHSVGFSAVLFHFCVLECNLFPHHSRSLFGFVNVPAYLYPWTLLIVLQFIMPNLSFTGHLSGIITGTLQSAGFFDVVFVSNEYMREMESWRMFSKLTAIPSFVSVPVAMMESSSRQQGAVAALVSAIRHGVGAVGRFVRHMWQALVVIIFGRGAERNANIQLPTFSTSSWRASVSSFSTFGTGMTSNISDDDAEDDDWVGLPTPCSPSRSPNQEPISHVV